MDVYELLPRGLDRRRRDGKGGWRGRSQYEELVGKGRAFMEANLFDGEYFHQNRSVGRIGRRRSGGGFQRKLEHGLLSEAIELLQKEGPKYQYGSGILLGWCTGSLDRSDVRVLGELTSILIKSALTLRRCTAFLFKEGTGAETDGFHRCGKLGERTVTPITKRKARPRSLPLTPGPRAPTSRHHSRTWVAGTGEVAGVLPGVHRSREPRRETTKASRSGKPETKGPRDHQTGRWPGTGPMATTTSICGGSIFDFDIHPDLHAGEVLHRCKARRCGRGWTRRVHGFQIRGLQLFKLSPGIYIFIGLLSRA